jgi:hypothetical protein
MGQAMVMISKDETLLRKAMKGCERAEWTKAIEAELTQIKRLDTWDLVKAPPDTNVIPSGYVFRQKHDSNGKIEHYKAQCIAKGYMQQFGIDYILFHLLFVWLLSKSYYCLLHNEMHQFTKLM